MYKILSKVINALDRNVIKRAASSLAIALLIYCAITAGEVGVQLLILVITAISCYELKRIMQASTIKFYAACVLLVFIPNASIIYLYHTNSIALLYMVICIFSNDIFAYLVGKFFAKRKIFPDISPNKTWLGTFAGLLATIISGSCASYILKLSLAWCLLTPVISLLALLGDFAESYIKRLYNAKDSGTLIPGHGGVLDRLDSFTLNAPFLLVLVVLL